jgi:hypothetical protein
LDHRSLGIAGRAAERASLIGKHRQPLNLDFATTDPRVDLAGLATKQHRKNGLGILPDLWGI